MLNAIWAYCCAYKVTTKSTPFQLVYDLEAIIPIEMELPSFRIAIDHQLGDAQSLRERYTMLEKLDAMLARAYLNMIAIQKHIKTNCDSKLIPKSLNENDLVLIYDNGFQKFLGKFKIRWFGPS